MEIGDWASSSDGSEVTSPHTDNEDDCFAYGDLPKLQFRKCGSKARWKEELGMAEIVSNKGRMWITTGIMRGGKLYTFLEDTLFLAEIGALHLFDNMDKCISLEDIYKKVAEGIGGSSWESFEVYRHLKSLGYIIKRHGVCWSVKHAKSVTASVEDESENGSEEKVCVTQVTELFSCMQMNEIRPVFDVYPPNSKFRKSSPGEPMFILCIICGNPPTKKQIEDLERRCEDVRAIQSGIIVIGIELAKTQIALSDKVKQEVPSSWDPTALAEFIQKYGTHIVVGVKMGGKDVIYLKQLQSSDLEPKEVQNLLKQLTDDDMSEASVSGSHKSLNEKAVMQDKRAVAWDLPPAVVNSFRPSVVSRSKKDDILSIHVRRGGVDEGQSHKSWLSTVSQAPNVISMSFVPITALLSGVCGSGFLSHAINLYLRYKPPIEELEQFLEFQLPRQWAPAYADLPLASRRKKNPSSSLQFTFLGPRIYVNTVKVTSENRPVTGVRLYLEGQKSDRLAIHLQHLSSVPKMLELTDELGYKASNEPIEKGYLEPVKCSIFSHVCTFPVEYNDTCIDDSASIVTKAWFEVKGVGMKKVMFLRLGYSMVRSGMIRRSEWDGPSMHSRKSGLMLTLMSAPFSIGLGTTEQKPVKVVLNSAIYPDGPPPKAPKLSCFVDTKEMVRGPEEPPGYWVVTGAKLCVEGGRIRVKVKYSLLTIMSEESMFT